MLRGEAHVWSFRTAHGTQKKKSKLSLCLLKSSSDQIQSSEKHANDPADHAMSSREPSMSRQHVSPGFGSQSSTCVATPMKEPLDGWLDAVIAPANNMEPTNRPDSDFELT